MRGKWRDERGETLIEVVASVLIMTLAVVLLFGAVMTSVRINKRAKESDEKFYTALNAAERQGAGDEAADVDSAASKVKVEQKDTAGNTVGSSREAAVKFYGGEGVLSYKYSP